MSEHSAEKDAGRGSRKKGYWPDGRSVIPGLPDLHESVEKDAGVTLTEAEWNSLCRAAFPRGPEVQRLYRTPAPTHPPAPQAGASVEALDQEFAVVVAALLAGRIDGSDAIRSLTAIAQRELAQRDAAVRAEVEREVLDRLGQQAGQFHDVLDREIADSLRKDREYVAAHDTSVGERIASAIDQQSGPGTSDASRGAYLIAARIARTIGGDR